MYMLNVLKHLKCMVHDPFLPEPSLQNATATQILVKLDLGDILSTAAPPNQASP